MKDNCCCCSCGEKWVACNLDCSVFPGLRTADIETSTSVLLLFVDLFCLLYFFIRLFGFCIEEEENESRRVLQSIKAHQAHSITSTDLVLKKTIIV